MADTPKWLESLSKLSPEKQLARMAKWKPSTLIGRAQKLGLDTFAESTLKRMKSGAFTPSAKTLTKIGKQLASKAVMPEAIIPASPVVVGSNWMSLAEWLEGIAARKPETNVEFSLARLGMLGFAYVYQSGGATYLANQKSSVAPKGKPAVPNYAIYSITVEEGDEVETWFQASEGEPDMSRARTNEMVKGFEENNQTFGNFNTRLNEVYTWWSHNATDAEYKFIGIGVLN